MVLFLQISFVSVALSCVRSQIVLTESGGDVKKAGDSLKLTCTVTGTSVSDSHMYWFRQAPGKGLQWLAYYYSDSSNTYSDAVKGRFTASKDNSNLYLHTIDLKTEDTAVYYCTRDDPYTYGDPRDKLIFGKGTSLKVEPREQTPSTPSVFVLISDDVKNSTAACLAKNFYPDTLTMSMNSSFGESVESQKVQGALSKSGKYTAVRIHTFKQRGDVQCSASHEGKPIHSYGVATQSDPKPSSSPLPKSTCKPEPRSINTDVKNMEKVNMLSLTVLGLRVLFAKSLAFNVLLSVRLIAF